MLMTMTTTTVIIYHNHDHDDLDADDDRIIEDRDDGVEDDVYLQAHPVRVVAGHERCSGSATVRRPRYSFVLAPSRRRGGPGEM